MVQLENQWQDGRPGGLLFAPASSYPHPAAYVADHRGKIHHRWSHDADQPKPEDNPPNYLRGWNHVELDANGNLYAIVPLRSLLKLTPDSRLEWACDVAAHHDLAIDENGSVLVLSETPLQVTVEGQTWVILDNRVTCIGSDGVSCGEFSLFDILCTDPRLRSRIYHRVARRGEQFLRRGWPLPTDEGVPLDVVRETEGILRTGTYRGEPRHALQKLRALPGSPCDVLHTNTLELLDRHPAGLWQRGDVMVCMRELGTIAVVDLHRAEVRWWWGPGELSGPHQPSMLPDGRVLVFDNGADRGWTRLLIVDPTTDEVVWSWSRQPPESFFCPLAGGCEQQKNGNILVTNSTGGGAFEVTMTGRVVWQLTLPVDVYGADRGRVSIYRMSAVDSEVLSLLRGANDPSEKAPIRRGSNP